MPDQEERPERPQQGQGRDQVQPQPGTAEPMDASAYAASSSESGGLYREEGPTLADAEGQPVSERPEMEEPSGGREARGATGRDDRGEQPEDRPGVGDVYRGGS